MKILLTAVIAAQIATATAAVSIAVDNNAGIDSNLITDSSGSTIAQGEAVVAIGYFTVTAANIVDFSSFIQVGATYVDFSTETAGFFAGSVSADLSELGVDAAAIGEAAYVVIGDNTTDITQSNNWLVWQTNDNFTGNPTEGPSAMAVINGAGTLVKGDFAVFQDSVPGIGNDAFTLTVVPEPSSLALLGLGAAAFLFRRRK